MSGKTQLPKVTAIVDLLSDILGEEIDMLNIAAQLFRTTGMLTFVARGA